MSLIRKLNVIIASLPNARAVSKSIVEFLASCVHIIAAMNNRDGAHAISVALGEILGTENDALINAVAINLAMVLGNSTIDERIAFASAHANTIPATLQRKIISICGELPSSSSAVEFAQHEKYFCIRNHKLHVRHLIENHTWSLADIEANARGKDIGFILINTIGMRGITYLIIDIASRIVDKNRANFVMIVHDANIVADDKNIVARVSERAQLIIMTGSEKKCVAITNIVQIL